MDIGRVNRRSAQQHAAAGTVTHGKRVRFSRTDRWGRELGKRNPDGRPYEPCVSCGRRSMVREHLNGETAWRCEWCGYRDTEHGPLV